MLLQHIHYLAISTNYRCSRSIRSNYFEKFVNVLNFSIPGQQFSKKLNPFPKCPIKTSMACDIPSFAAVIHQNNERIVKENKKEEAMRILPSNVSFKVSLIEMKWLNFKWIIVFPSLLKILRHRYFFKKMLGNKKKR